jgi:hypothetical protein
MKQKKHQENKSLDWLACKPKSWKFDLGFIVLTLKSIGIYSSKIIKSILVNRAIDHAINQVATSLPIV